MRTTNPMITTTTMKKLLILTSICLVLSGTKVMAQMEEALVNDCAKTIGEDATYLKEFVADLDGASGDEKAPSAKFSMILSKNTLYKFTVCNSDSKPGKGVLQLFDTTELLGSSFNAASGKEYQSFNFMCQKTGVYNVFISFQEGKAGTAVGILSFVKKL